MSLPEIARCQDSWNAGIWRQAGNNNRWTCIRILRQLYICEESHTANSERGLCLWNIMHLVLVSWWCKIWWQIGKNRTLCIQRMRRSEVDSPSIESDTKQLKIIYIMFLCQLVSMRGSRDSSLRQSTHLHFFNRLLLLPAVAADWAPSAFLFCSSALAEG